MCLKLSDDGQSSSTSNPTSSSYSWSSGTSGPGAPDPAAEALLDSEADALAAVVAAQIANLPDSNLKEYGALVWQDSAGNLHVTTIEQGNATNTPLGALWSQVDFANGGKVVGVIHSHPTHYIAGTDPVTQEPIIALNQSAGTLSSADFDHLIDRANGEPGFDTDSYRSYLVFDGEVKEYWAEDQPDGYYDQGGQATWAVERTS